MIRPLLALSLLAAASTPARAELVYFTSGRTLSVAGTTPQGSAVVLRLRTGGELVCDAALIERIAPDEVPYPEAASADVAVVSPAVAVAQPRTTPDPRFDGLIKTAANRHGVDADLVRAVIQVESGYQPRARSSKGAVGLMQVMPATGRQYGAGNLYDPVTNLEVGIRHLRTLLDRFPLKLALAAYNAGSGSVERYGGIPPFRETESYVARILALVGS